MDRKIQEGLEDYLHGLNANARVQVRGLMSQKPGNSFEETLAAADAETRREVAEFRETAGMLHSLQVNEEEVPQLSASFYARVMERIETERAGNSFWSLFLNPVFSRRLLFASATLLVLLAATLVTIDGDGGLGAAAPELFAQDAPIEMQQPVDAGEPETTLVSHSGHDQLFMELATYQ